MFITKISFNALHKTEGFRIKTVWLLVALILVAGLVWAARIYKPKVKGDVSINTKDGAEMVWVPAGEFLMGSNHLDSEKPQHSVYLDGYWIYKYEVTVAQYRKFCLETGKLMPEAPMWGWIDNHPILHIAWQDAADYAKWAGTSLPTEAQWEKAARGTDGREYPWGNQWDASKCNEYSKGPGKTEPVGSYPAGASPYGCMDMSGNVWEWCADWYDEDYYKSAPSQNPYGPSNGKYRVLRGGGYGDPDYNTRCAVRDTFYPKYGLGNYGGFRLAR